MEINIPNIWNYPTRRLLAENTESKMTTIPRIFINGKDMRGADDLAKISDEDLLALVNSEA